MNMKNSSVDLSPNMAILQQNYANSPGYNLFGTSVFPKKGVGSTVYHSGKNNREMGIKSSIFSPDQKRLL
jgi:hypothetical protein